MRERADRARFISELKANPSLLRNVNVLEVLQTRLDKLKRDDSKRDLMGELISVIANDLTDHPDRTTPAVFPIDPGVFAEVKAALSPRHTLGKRNAELPLVDLYATQFEGVTLIHVRQNMSDRGRAVVYMKPIPSI